MTLPTKPTTRRLVTTLDRFFDLLQAQERSRRYEAALTRINHGEGRTATDLQRIAASALEGEK